MRGAAGQAAREPVGDLQEQVPCARSHQHRAEHDEYQDIARHYLQRLAVYPAGLRPEVQNHRPQALRGGLIGAREDPRPVREQSLGEEVDDPEQAERHDEQAEIPIGQIKHQRGRHRERQKIDRASDGKKTPVDCEQVDNPDRVHADGKRDKHPVQPLPLVQGQGANREGEDHGQSENQPRRKQKGALESLESRAKPVLPEQQALIPPAQLVERRGGRLNEPANELRHRARCGIG